MMFIGYAMYTKLGVLVNVCIYDMTSMPITLLPTIHKVDSTQTVKIPSTG